MESSVALLSTANQPAARKLALPDDPSQGGPRRSFAPVAPFAPFARVVARFTHHPLRASRPAGRGSGTDIKTVQATWPIDKPLVDSLGRGLREVRSTHDKVECRVIFVLDGSSMVLLHGFTKTTQKTKKADIDTALQRKAIREKSR
jgi:phage-related protein